MIINKQIDGYLYSGLNYGLDLMKKSLLKTASDSAVKVVKQLVVKVYTKQIATKNKKSTKKQNKNLIQLRSGDLITFVVQRNGSIKAIDNDVEVIPVPSGDGDCGDDRQCLLMGEQSANNTKNVN
ncbi:uncharacterized protein LOC128956849 [Oppia nitens]|uniref:uncharacterized protein LOC128956849 n=1 Tax=Oppia nitens TaxID=1686743 RepID=UPI0023DBB848|nr:uncharacterized protein LOC128956849 [Oppia nitens]